MKRWIASFAGIALFLSLSNAAASHGRGPATVSVTHSAPIPCTVACGYWEAPSAAGFNECENPFPEGSYDETTFRLTSTTDVVHIQAWSRIDHDHFICTDTEPRVLVQAIANLCCEPCDGIAGEGALAIGCTESGDLTWSGLSAANDGANDRFIVMSYNWSDTGPSLVDLWGPIEMLDDSYEARLPIAAGTLREDRGNLMRKLVISLTLAVGALPLPITITGPAEILDDSFKAGL